MTVSGHSTRFSQSRTRRLVDRLPPVVDMAGMVGRWVTICATASAMVGQPTEAASGSGLGDTGLVWAAREGPAAPAARSDNRALSQSVASCAGIGPGDVPALHAVAAELGQQPPLVGLLDALGDGRQLQRVGEVDQRADDAHRAVVVGHGRRRRRGRS